MITIWTNQNAGQEATCKAYNIVAYKQSNVILLVQLFFNLVQLFFYSGKN